MPQFLPPALLPAHLIPFSMPHPTLHDAPLGHEVSYPAQYDPKQLFPVARAGNRQSLALPDTWFGGDIWNAYEISWLNSKGKPMVAIGRFDVPWDSPNLIESKSLKLYLNSLNETRFEGMQDIQAVIQADLSKVAGAQVDVTLDTPQKLDNQPLLSLPGVLLDDLDIAIEHYEPAPGLLQCQANGETVSETLVSHLLKSNCPVTGQPDWGSVQVSYRGPRIAHDSLLQYIVSLRRHTEFHEHCVEKIFCDIWHACRPESLAVYARYTRRGGLDINPWRSSHPSPPANTRNPRQ